MENNSDSLKYLQDIFKSKDNRSITDMYNMYRGEFIRFIMRKYQIEEEVVAEIYQESFIALYDVVIGDKLTHLACSAKTYLFSIGKNRALKYLNETKKVENIENIDLYLHLGDAEGHQSEEWMEMQNEIREVVEKLQEPCNTVLSLYYWERKSMREIAAEMNYKNEQIAKNRKSLCIKTLKNRFAKKARYGKS